MSKLIIWGFVILALVCAFVWVNEPVSLILAIFALGVVVADIICCVIGRLFVDFDIEACADEQSGSITWILNMKNRSIIPVFGIEIKLAFENLLTSGQSDCMIYMAMKPRQKYVEALPLKGVHCGRLESEIKSVHVKGLFGLCNISVPCKCQAGNYGFPLKKEIYVNPTTSVTTSCGDEGRLLHKKGDDHSEILKIREFVKGDNPKLIHHKLSSRMGKKMVREYDSRIFDRILVFFCVGESPSEKMINDVVNNMSACCKGYLANGDEIDVLLMKRDKSCTTKYHITNISDYESFITHVLDGNLEMNRTAVMERLLSENVLKEYVQILCVNDRYDDSLAELGVTQYSVCETEAA